MSAFVTAAIAAALTAAALTWLPRRRGFRRLTVTETTARRYPTPRWLRRRPSSAVLPAELARWIDDLARAVRRGATLHAAISTTVPDDEALRGHTELLRHWLARGATVTDASDEWAVALTESSASRIQLLRSFAAVVAATSTVGGSSAEPLDRFASAMRERVAVDLERAAHSAQATMSARVLTALPLGVLSFLLATDEAVRSVVASPPGAGVVLVGAALSAAGAWWMQRIVRTTGQSV